MSSSLRVELTSHPPASWAGFAASSGVFYHEPVWIETIGRAFGFRLACLTAERESVPLGGLALAEVPGLIGRRRLVSLPFSYAAGPTATDPAVSAALLEQAVAVAKQWGIKRVEIKRRDDAPPPPAGYSRSSRYHTYRVDTSGGEAAVWAKLHQGSTRRSIQKGERSGVRVVEGESAAEWLEMARLNEQNAHRHGTPAPPRRWFTEWCRHLQTEGLARLYLARTPEGKYAAGIVMWTGRREWIYAFGASRPEELHLRPNHVLLWHAMRQAIALSVPFDLGRAAPEQDGLVEFKTRWGGQPTPLSYDYWPDAAGLNVAHRSKGTLGTAAAIWRRLPESAARMGSFLYRYLG